MCTARAWRMVSSRIQSKVIGHHGAVIYGSQRRCLRKEKRHGSSNLWVRRARSRRARAPAKDSQWTTTASMLWPGPSPRRVPAAALWPWFQWRVGSCPGYALHPRLLRPKKTCPPCKKRNKQGKCKKKTQWDPVCRRLVPAWELRRGRLTAMCTESAGTTCAGRCGTWSNTCGKAVKCPQCPDGQICLTNGSCALPCTGMGSCPAACLGCPTTFLNTEGQTHCVGSSSGTLGPPQCRRAPRPASAPAVRSVSHVQRKATCAALRCAPASRPVRRPITSSAADCDNASNRRT